jgi:hypothetical protein
MPLQIFVEDKLADAYEILALRALGLPARKDRRRVRASRLDRRDLTRVATGSIKSRGASIAEHVDPARARRHNGSLAYFYDMVDGRRSGCEHPFPE